MGRRGWALAALSGSLLTLAFPRWNLWILAWVALIPLFYALENSRNRKEAFLFGFTAGFTFFILSISWLRHVTVFGMFFVVAMSAFYWGIFGMVFYSATRSTHRVAPRVISSACWVALEFIRSELPVWGFGWNLLGVSQASNLLIAQLASLGGVYSVSFLVLLTNTVIYFLFRHGVKKGFQTLVLTFLLLGACLIFGWSRMEVFSPVSLFRVSVLQGNIPQFLKWDANYKEKILKIYLNLTELASYDRPQLIVWPEAAYPGFFNRELDAERVKELIRKIQIPLVVGSPHEGERGFYNSAYLLNPSGETVQRYDKIRLVPFGEYVPWKRIFGFLESYAYALGVSDFSPGHEFTVFKMGDSGPRFSVLICFEDIFPALARRFADRGAGFLTVITNDAWFGHSSAPYQHLQASVFRAIENGVSIVRAANTGLSGFINSRGQVTAKVRNQEGKDTFVMGGMTYPVDAVPEMTIYRRGGWLFPYGCLAVLVIYGILAARPQREVPKVAVFILLTLLFFGCVRIAGGAFYAKKGKAEEPPQVKEVYVDSDQLLRQEKNPAAAKIEA